MNDPTRPSLKLPTLQDLVSENSNNTLPTSLCSSPHNLLSPDIGPPNLEICVLLALLRDTRPSFIQFYFDLHHSLFFNLLDITNSILNNNRIYKQAPLKNIQIIVINTGEPTVDHLLVYPTTEQNNIIDNCLKPTVTFHTINHTPTQTIPDITIELRQRTVDELITYPTIEQFLHNHNVLKPITM
ncbi:hypothetical protein CEXT_545991 [Caerostris extrusa]|uniref:Uncharacterized protein n=1 Tax=Caerostris extrusa TaxID=172846 RepID=A0AAV4MWU1_CAEEX|nr:hypothetical protein CEXT_545991 [Caerostris extrusa]